MRIQDSAVDRLGTRGGRLREESKRAEEVVAQH